MTLIELGIGTVASTAIGVPIAVDGVKKGSKPLIAIGATIAIAPITYAAVLIASAKIEEKASKKKMSSYSDEA